MWEVYPRAQNTGYLSRMKGDVCVCSVRVEGPHTPALLLLSFQQEWETKEGTRIATNSFLIQ